MNIAIYSRKSVFTSKGDSVENQVQMCKDYVFKNLNINPHDVDFILYEDEGYSGGNVNRPKFQELLKDIKSNKFDILICYRLDRISRNVADFSSTLELLQKHNVSFISIKEQFDTNSPIGKAMVYIASVFAQLERETIAERVRDNMLELAKSGRWLGGQTPLGFESEKISYMDQDYKERTMYKLAPIDSELKLVELIYSKYFELQSIRKVTQWLLEYKYKTKLKSEWTARSVSDLLQNPTYVKASEDVFSYLSSKNITCIGKPDNKHGILTYNKKKGQTKYRKTDEWIAAIAKHDGIIDAEKWLQIQKILNKNKTRAPRTGKTNNALLTGLIRCAKCGSPMNIVHGSKDKNGNTRYYYSCSLKIYSKGTRCNNSNINTLDAETAVIKNLRNCTSNTGLLLKEITSIKEKINNSEDLTVETKFLNTELTSRRNAIKNLVKRLSENSNSVASKYIIDEIEKIESEIKEFEKKLHSLKGSKETLNKSNLDIKIIIDNLLNFNKLINSADIHQKKYLISTLVNNITWNGDTGEIGIELWGSAKKK